MLLAKYIDIPTNEIWKWHVIWAYSGLLQFMLQIKEISARLEKVEPKVRPSDALASHFGYRDMKPTNLPSISQKKSSPKVKNSARESSLFGG